MLRRTLLATLFLGGLLLTGLSPQALAAYTVDPLRVEVAIPAGKSVATTSVRINNTGNDPIRLKAYLENWTLDNHGGLKMLDNAIENGIAERVRFNPKEFEIAPKSAQVIRLAVSLPKDSPDGEYRGMLFFEDLKTQQQRFESQSGLGAAVEIKQRLGMAVYVYKGEPKPSLTLGAFQCTSENGKLKTAIEFKNTGNKHARVLGTLLLKRDGQPVQELQLNGLHDIVILPSQNRQVEQVLMEDLANLEPGDYEVELHVNPSSKTENTGGLAQTASTQFTLAE